ncbi:serine/threonine-protein kinase [Pseudonocardia sp. TRM90224]|uniref:serine/threonine-protein kinase n=1 Tax=Pseudonocardia sp. TRM90224 TaxID=2812678 RepID=UPI001E50877F|nr:serine/threonine-protein kinase [Pseudonocardia sp. TRM90224]
MTSAVASDTDPPDEPVAGRYALGPVIGTGSSAVVRRGRDLRDGSVVAIKLFRSGATDHDLRQQHREMNALLRLDHPGLVALRGGGIAGGNGESGDEGRPYIVTDLVDGPALAAVLRNGPLDPDSVRRIGVELADVLAHVHANGIVHRDVKPANVLLEGWGTADGARVRLTDFGIARTVDGAVATAAGLVVGTAAYLAPEQARGEIVGPPSDVYALGLVLLEALTGRREYPGQPIESASARLHRRPAVPAGLPYGLTPLLQAMTADAPCDRPSAEHVAALLRYEPVSRLDIGADTDIGTGSGRHAAHSAGPGPRHAAADDEPAPTLVAAAVRGPARHRKRVPRRLRSPLTAAMIVLAGLGGIAMSLGSDEPPPAVPSSAP